MNQKRKRNEEYIKKQKAIKLKRLKEDLDIEEERRIMKFEEEFKEEILKKNLGGIFRSLNEEFDKAEKKNKKK